MLFCLNQINFSQNQIALSSVILKWVAQSLLKIPQAFSSRKHVHIFDEYIIFRGEQKILSGGPSPNRMEGTLF